MANHAEERNFFTANTVYTLQIPRGLKDNAVMMSHLLLQNLKIYTRTVPANNLHLLVQTESVTAGVEATTYSTV